MSQQAKERDRELAEARASGRVNTLGCLHGVPITLKERFAIQGFKQTLCMLHCGGEWCFSLHSLSRWPIRHDPTEGLCVEGGRNNYEALGRRRCGAAWNHESTRAWAFVRVCGQSEFPQEACILTCGEQLRN